jgi:hypothetical protein
MKQQFGWKVGMAVAAIVILATVACRNESNSAGTGQGGAAPAASSTASAASTAPSPSPVPANDDAEKNSGVTIDELNGVFKHLDLNSVELKLTVDDSDRQSAVKALDIDALDAQLRQTTFFDTKDLALSKAGVVARLRRIQGKPATATIKLRPLKPAQVTPELRAVPGLSIELDVMPDRYICSASMEKDGVDDKLAREVVAQRKPISALFSEQQRAFYKEQAPQGLDLDSLRVLGPINLLLLKFTPKGFDRNLVAELWLYPDGSRVLEISTKCKPGEAEEVAKKTTAFLNSRGVKAALIQTTKARTALEYFSKLQ